MSFLNNSKGERGKTKEIDFQFHLSPYKWAADVNLTAYKSSYISPKGYGAPIGMNYYVRPDVDYLIKRWQFNFLIAPPESIIPALSVTCICNDCICA